MSPNNLSQTASVREWQKYFKEAFNLALAAADITYNTSSVSGLIIGKNITINSGQTLTLSGPTTFVCQTFTNNGTITGTAVAESTLGKYRTTNAPRIPEIYRLGDENGRTAFTGTTVTAVEVGGIGGPSYGSGGFASDLNVASLNGLTDGYAITSLSGTSQSSYRKSMAKGWLDLGLCPLWWPIAYFRNPILGQGCGMDANLKYLCASPAFQRRGGNSGSFSNTMTIRAALGGNPGTFLEVFCKDFINAAGKSITCIGAAGVTNGSGSGGTAGGGGGCICVYAENSLQQLGTLDVSGGAGFDQGAVSNGGGGGGGGGGIFLTSPSITNSGTNTIAGGVTNGSRNGTLPGGSGVLFTETYLRLWMSNEYDTLVDTR